MWRFITIILLLGIVFTSAHNLKYLNPTKLQTETPPEVQKDTASFFIQKYIRPEQFNLEIDPKLFKDNKDSFSLKIVRKKLHIKASTGVAALWGFNHYLKKYCKSQIEWQTKNVNIPQPLPYVNETVIANDRFRYYQNAYTASYSFVWWKPQEWFQHLEWMALNGINLVLAPVAQEAAWSRIYRQIGMTQEEIDQHSSGPAFLSWLRMGKVHGWGGPLPQSWHDLQMEIQRLMIPSMLALGIVPVLPTFNGHVPAAFARMYPNSTFHKVSQWNNFSSEYCCGLFIDPNDPLFKVIGKMFLNEFKTSGVHIYTAEPFHEISVPAFSTSFARDTAQAIFSTLSEFDPDAVWLLQNWMFVHDPLTWPLNRVQAFITSVPNGRMLILDLQAEQWPQYNLYKMYYGQPFIWCMLHNFGGTLGMFGNMVTINRDVYEVRSRTNSTMIGIGLTPEGINQNYVVYDLMLESAWRKSPVRDLEAWAADYAERRYGCNEGAEAWKYLLKSVYSFNGLNSVRGKYVVTMRPSFRIKPWAWYGSYDLFQAFKELVFINDTVCNSEGYRYDVVDVTRQALQYRAEQLYINVVNDRHMDKLILENSIKRFLSAINDMSSILTESDYFTASDWFVQAARMGKNADERLLYEMNARNQITLWGPKGEVSDYAGKQWAELISGYYRPRWHKFLYAALEAKKESKVFNETETMRLITEYIEIPYTTTQFGRADFKCAMTSFRWEDTKDFAKSLYNKWAHITDLEDLPMNVIEAEAKTITNVKPEIDVTIA